MTGSGSDLMVAIMLQRKFIPLLQSMVINDHLLSITRSYAALRAADLDWIVRPGYSLGRVHSGRGAGQE